MELKPVGLIRTERSYGHLQELIDEFAAMDAEVVRVDIGVNDYKSPKVAGQSIWAAIRRSNGNVEVWLRSYQVFVSGAI